MPLMHDIRQSVNSAFIKLLMLLLVVSFVTFYGYNASTGCNPSAIAKVNGNLITEQKFSQRLSAQMDMYRRILKKDLDPSMMGFVEKSVLDRMINEELLVAAAQQNGFGLGDTAVRNIIKQQFADPSTGKFDLDFYKKYVTNRLRTTPGRFEADIRGELIAQRFQNLLGESLKTSEEEVKMQLLADRRQINAEFVAIDPSKVAGVAAPTETQLNDYYNTHKDKYRLPAKRKFEYLAFNPADYLDDVDGRVQAFFDKEFKGNSDYNEWQLRASHILVKEESDAKKLHAQLKTGADFGALARAHSTDPSGSRDGDLGYFGPGKMVKPFEAAALKLKVGEISGPVKSNFGYHLIRLTDRIEAAATHLNDQQRFSRLEKMVRERFNEELKTNSTLNQDAVAKIKTIAAEIKTAAQKAPQRSLKDLLKGNRAEYGTSPALSLTDSVPGMADGAMLVRKAFDLKVGEVSEPVNGWMAGRQFLVRAVNEESGKDRGLVEVRDQVSLEVAKDLRQQRTDALAREALQGMGQGETAAAVAKKLGGSREETGWFGKTNGATVPKVGFSQEASDALLAAAPQVNRGVLNKVITVGDKVYAFRVTEEKIPSESELAASVAPEITRRNQEKQQAFVSAWLKNSREKADKAGDVVVYSHGGKGGNEAPPEF